MPLYEYRCAECDATFEKFMRSFSKNEEIECPECASRDVGKAFSSFATSSTSKSTPSAASCAPSGGG
ncbi:MAG: hypothetical protein MAG451_01573 [Anaerolineales bacterium]|nr:hypothetical protein [Anaerolineales bacterium]